MTCFYPASAPFQRPTTTQKPQKTKTQKTAENQSTKHAKKRTEKIPRDQERKQNQGLGFYLKVKGFLP